MIPRRAWLFVTLMLAGGGALWLAAALRLLPWTDWPSWPLDPAAMSVDQILLGFGLMPRGAVALVAGAALGLSGAILQAVLRNPVADPGILGLNSGAALAVVIGIRFLGLDSVGGYAVAAVAGWRTASAVP